MDFVSIQADGVRKIYDMRKTLLSQEQFSIETKFTQK